ncbi:protein-tyrosine phosphatase [Bacillus sp. OV322]|uniref:tyrosine-protein phosphatase n=1 Tax=Bacillus sp. OV322 TaxID=1882764 RepID=UPI0008F0A50E|nr:CpsB/CapC family capsule biosynthesis tyrosine phosphatase [Bacillus sp. OV322]SFC52695.1 protein-tyrosine phosphatase [Bacillus sp. OV322]
MIDIHCHILPGIDDGAKTIADSLDMAKVAVQEGITSIIATPHHKNGSYDNTKKDILSKVRELNEVLKNSSVPLTILPGQETRIYGELLEDYDAGDILPLNISSSYLFIELPSGHVPRYTERLLYDVQNKGLTPIIVHPERNRELIQNPDILYQLVKNGALTQVTASSLAGYFGKNITKFSHQLIEANLTHFISSDAHNTTNRSFKLMEALDDVEKQFGVDMVYFFQENAELIVQGQSVYKEIPEKITKKKFLGLF